MQEVNILSTKKIVPALMEQASAAGIHITCIDFIRTEPLLTKEKETALKNLPLAALVFTSINAVESLYKLLLRFPNTLPSSDVYCLAGRTLEKLVEYFPELTIKGTGNNATELAEKIIADGCREIVFFCGNLRRDYLPDLLKQKGIRVNELEIYKTFHTPSKLIKQFAGIFFFSPSAVESFFSVNQIGNNTTCFAIGDTTADALKQHTNNRIMVANNPRQEDMITMVIDHFSTR